MKKVVLLVLASLVSACASYPEKVRVADETNLVSFETASKSVDNGIGQKARWSGVIADVKNLKQSTQIDVLYYPATSIGRPNTSKEPIGRFRVIVPKFLDPVLYVKGKAITALGTLKEKESDKIGEYEYAYPTISDATVYLWSKQKPIRHTQIYYGWYGPHPTYYWRGGIRYVYKAKPSSTQQPTHVAPIKDNKR
jgi:outer membrane lipoprotein